MEIKAFILAEKTATGWGICDEIHFREKDALKSKANWEADWDVFKEILPCTITYEEPN